MKPPPSQWHILFVEVHDTTPLCTREGRKNDRNTFGNTLDAGGAKIIKREGRIDIQCAKATRGLVIGSL